MAFKDDVVKAVDFITGLPRDVARQADKWNQEMISIAQDLESALAAGGQRAEQNLRQNKIESTGRDAASWVSNNPWLAGGALLVLIILIRRI